MKAITPPDLVKNNRYLIGTRNQVTGEIEIFEVSFICIRDSRCKTYLEYIFRNDKKPFNMIILTENMFYGQNDTIVNQKLNHEHQQLTGNSQTY